MTPAIVTVATAAWWEPALVGHARRTGIARVVARVTHPGEVERWAGTATHVVAGSSCPWLAAAAVARWRAAGLRVVGVVEEGDRAAGGWMAGLGCDRLATDHPASLAAALDDGPTLTGPGQEIWVVTGPRGSPGRSEVALALAWRLAAGGGRATLLDADLEAPGLGLRLGLPPQVGPPTVRAWGRIGVVTPVPGATDSDLEQAAAAVAGRLVVDAGPSPAAVLRWWPDRVVMVASPSPAGVVRAAVHLGRLPGVRPAVLANRSDGEGARLLQAALGAPVARVPEVDGLGEGRPPSPAMVEAVGRAVSLPEPSGSFPGT